MAESLRLVSDGRPRAPQDPFSVFRTALRQRRLAPNTIKNYVRTIERFDEWCRDRGTTARAATTDDLLDYAATLPFTYWSMQRIINAYKAWWRIYLKRKDDCPADSIRCPSRPRQVYRGLETGHDARTLITAARDLDGLRAQAVCALLYFAALRNEEAASLPMAADQESTLHIIGKGAQSRTVPIARDLRVILDEWFVERNRRPQSRSPFMFPGRLYGSPISTNTVNVCVGRAGAAAGLGHVTPHQLRYTAGARMYEFAGADLRATGVFLGHSASSSAITWGYTRSTDRKLRELADSL